jgi:hypothetical protein
MNRLGEAGLVRLGNVLWKAGSFFLSFFQFYSDFLNESTGIRVDRCALIM